MPSAARFGRRRSVDGTVSSAAARDVERAVRPALDDAASPLRAEPWATALQLATQARSLFASYMRDCGEPHDASGCLALRQRTHLWSPSGELWAPPGGRAILDALHPERDHLDASPPHPICTNQ